ncbi:MAG: DEAD/DEAH box helicase [Clostridia bacterium]|jgi:ATP-dependent RNA helicase DeaD|nr:DEAD/DEAH box helicase [Clostridia bacterium]
MEEKNIEFEELEISKETKRALKVAGYINATPIQQKAIPCILQGEDLIGQSKTGTGKTASYGLPIIEKIEPKEKTVQAIILCPTRELAVQISEEIKKFTKYKENIKNLAIYGGQSIETQIRALKKGVQIVIGTPGRVMDHMRRKTLKLNNVKIVVLDEADEMLNMGFEEDIETILKDVPEQRQTVLFSATMNKKILGIAKKYLNNPKNIKIKSEELTVNNIEQISINIKEAMKEETLMRLIQVYNPKKAIVFCNTKKKVDNLIEGLKASGYKAEALHGDIKQIQRDRIMKKMKEGIFQILVATDVVARGIDIQDLELVINYDVPQEEEYYVHRIGRTGRNGNIGKAFTFVVGKEKNKINSIKKYANAKIREGKVPTLAEINKIQDKIIIENIQEIIDKNEFEHQEILEELLKNNQLEDIVKALLTKIYRKNRKKEEVNSEITIKTKDGEMVKLFFNLGRKDNIKVKDFVGSIAANSGISGQDIGKINILDKFSFIEVSQKHVQDIMQGMKGKQVKGKDCNIEIAKN